MRRMETTEIKPFLERFFYCLDGMITSILLYNVEIGVLGGGQITVYVDCQDKDQEFGEWCSLSIELRGVIKFKLTGSDRTSRWIFSCGIFIINENGKWGLDIGNRYEYPESLNELEQSPSFVVAKEIWWDVKPLQRT